VRLVNSFKLQVSFAKEPNKRDYIPKNTPVIVPLDPRMACATETEKKDRETRGFLCKPLLHSVIKTRGTIIGLFFGIQSLLLGSFAKETCNLKEPTNRSHPHTGWRRPIGSLKLQVIFRKRAITVGFREIETTVFDPASVFLSTH